MDIDLIKIFIFIYIFKNFYLFLLFLLFDKNIYMDFLIIVYMILLKK